MSAPVTGLDKAAILLVLLGENAASDIYRNLPQTDVEKITLRVQEPGSTEAREVVIKTRTQPGQRMSPGMRVPVVIDPTNPKRVYPASEEAAKRAVATGSRLERRVMQQQMRKPGRGIPQQPSGYQPPQSTLRPRR